MNDLSRLHLNGLRALEAAGRLGSLTAAEELGVSLGAVSQQVLKAEAQLGQPVFLAWPTLAAYALAEGQLAAPFPGRHRTGDAYWLATSAQRPKSAKVRKLEAWLREEFAAFAENDIGR